MGCGVLAVCCRLQLLHYVLRGGTCFQCTGCTHGLGANQVAHMGWGKSSTVVQLFPRCLVVCFGLRPAAHPSCGQLQGATHNAVCGCMPCWAGLVYLCLHLVWKCLGPPCSVCLSWRVPCSSVLCCAASALLHACLAGLPQWRKAQAAALKHGTLAGSATAAFSAVVFRS